MKNRNNQMFGVFALFSMAVLGIIFQAMALKSHENFNLITSAQTKPTRYIGIAGCPPDNSLFDRPYEASASKESRQTPCHEWRPGSAEIEVVNSDTRARKPINSPNFIRYVWCQDNMSWVESAARADVAANRTGRVWLLLNEPDEQDNLKGQCGSVLKTPSQVGNRYVDLAVKIKSIDPTAKIYLGGTLYISKTKAQSGDTTPNWWARTLDEVMGRLARDGLSPDIFYGTHYHLYPGLSDKNDDNRTVDGGIFQASNNFISFMDNYSYNGNKPFNGKSFIISETGGFKARNTQEAKKFMDDFANYFKGKSRIDSAFWFSGFVYRPVNNGVPDINWMYNGLTKALNGTYPELAHPSRPADYCYSEGANATDLGVPAVDQQKLPCPLTTLGQYYYDTYRKARY